MDYKDQIDNLFLVDVAPISSEDTAYNIDDDTDNKALTSSNLAAAWAAASPITLNSAIFSVPSPVVMATITGTSLNDRLYGTSDADDIRGQDGNDKILGAYPLRIRD